MHWPTWDTRPFVLGPDVPLWRCTFDPPIAVPAGAVLRTTHKFDCDTGAWTTRYEVVPAAQDQEQKQEVD